MAAATTGSASSAITSLLGYRGVHRGAVRRGAQSGQAIIVAPGLDMAAFED